MNYDTISRRAAIDRINKQREHLQPDIYPQDKIGDAAYRICAEFIERLPSAQPKIEERKEESAQNVPKEDLISRNAAIDAECEVCQIAPKKERGHNCTYYVHGCKEIECLRALPSAQPTLYGYNMEHLKLIAEVLRKENLSPERVAEALTDIGKIVSIVRAECEEGFRKAVERCMI